jgi:hypothetical protein
MPTPLNGCANPLSKIDGSSATATEVDYTTPLLPKQLEEQPPRIGIVNEKPLDPRVLFAEFVFTFCFVFLSVSNAGFASSGNPAANGAVVAALAGSGMA